MKILKKIALILVLTVSCFALGLAVNNNAEATSLNQRTFTETLPTVSNLTITSNNELNSGNEYVITIKADELFGVDELIIKMGGEELKKGEGYTLVNDSADTTNNTTLYKISKVTGNIELSVTAKDLKAAAVKTLNDYYKAVNTGLTKEQEAELKNKLEVATNNVNSATTTNQVNEIIENSKVELRGATKTPSWLIVPFAAGMFAIIIGVFAVAEINRKKDL